MTHCNIYSLLAPTAVVVMALAGQTSAQVINADGHPLTSAAHPGAILDQSTSLLWLDATETENRSLADVTSKLGPGQEFDSWRLATRVEIEQLFADAGLTQTSPGAGFVSSATEQAKVMSFVGIYGQTGTVPTLLGTNLWHADTFINTGLQGAMSALWLSINDHYWVGTNGTTTGFAGTAHPDWGVALVRASTAMSQVVNVDGHPLTSAAHPGAILDLLTNLLWLDATETQNRSLADVTSKLGPGQEFDSWRLATRAEIEQLFADAGLTQTSPGAGWVPGAAEQLKVMSFVGIYGQTDTVPTILGINLWHADTFINTGLQGGMSAVWLSTDDRFWVGTNGTTFGFAGTAHPGWGVALVRSIIQPCFGDANGDSTVNFADITEVLGHWLETCP